MSVSINKDLRAFAGANAKNQAFKNKEEPPK